MNLDDVMLKFGESVFLERHGSTVQSPIERMMAMALIISSEQWSENRNYPADEYFDLVQVGGWTVSCQHPIGRYRADFALRKQDWRIVVECDGHDFHERTKEQAKHDRSRDRAMTLLGWRVMRFTGSEIAADPFACADQVFEMMQSVDPTLGLPPSWPDDLMCMPRTRRNELIVAAEFRVASSHILLSRDANPVTAREIVDIAMMVADAEPWVVAGDWQHVGDHPIPPGGFRHRACGPTTVDVFRACAKWLLEKRPT